MFVEENKKTTRPAAFPSTPPSPPTCNNKALSDGERVVWRSFPGLGQVRTHRRVCGGGRKTV